MPNENDSNTPNTGNSNEQESLRQPTGKTRREMLNALKEKSPSKFQSLPEATQADMDKSNNESKVGIEKQEPLRVVEPKRFTALKSTMSNIDSYTVLMTYQDIVDYCQFAEHLYENSDTMSVTEKWQRPLENKRVKLAGAYLTDSDIHFLPPIITIPANNMDAIDIDTVADESSCSLTVKHHGLGILDGQHRVGGIMDAIERNPSLASESMPVVVLDIHELTTQQQIFADVNRTPRKVSQALNLVFDHSDKIAVLAQDIATRPQQIEGLVAFDGVSPKASAAQIMSLTNLYKLIKPMASAKQANGSPVLSNDQIADTVYEIVANLPRIGLVRKGTLDFKRLKEEYIFPFSTCWQAVGQLLEEMLTSKRADGGYRHTADEFPQVVARFIKRVSASDGWAIDGERWNDPNRRVVDNGKVGTQRDHISRAKQILRDFVDGETAYYDAQGQHDAGQEQPDASDASVSN